MAKSDARFGYQANLSRDDHDLSQRFGFTCAPGMLCPIFTDVATPGDSYYIEHDLSFLRTAPLAAPAMVDVIVHYESFFVPFQMIYQPIENTVFSIKQVQSSNFVSGLLQNNNLPLFDYGYHKDHIIDNRFTSVYRTQAFRLADFFGLNPLCFVAKVGSSISTYPNFADYSPSFFPYQILAYHTIFNYYYRLDDKSDFYNVDCNWDQHYASTSAVQLSSQYEFMQIRQRPWDFDYFTSVYRSAIVSDANMQQILPDTRYSNLVAQPTLAIKENGQYGTGLNSERVAFSSESASSFNAINQQLEISTAAIRQMFANEKLAMITGRTKKNYDSQVLAHFGVKVPHDVKHDISLIGEDHYNLQIGEVTSLASTSTAPLGELAGKGWATGKGKKHKFTAPCHGVVMTIFSIEPRRRYTTGFDRQNAVTKAFDLPIPEFDRLGNMPIYYYEIGKQNGAQPFTNYFAWKERYYQWKRRPSKANMAFMQPRGVLPNTNSFQPYMLAGIPYSVQRVDINTPVTTRPDLGDRFYISPYDMDAFMLVPFNYEWKIKLNTGDEDWCDAPWLVYSRDPFIVDSDLKVKKVSWMSKDGEPVYTF